MIEIFSTHPILVFKNWLISPFLGWKVLVNHLAEEVFGFQGCESFETFFLTAHGIVTCSS